jgi:energy-converting hydrogenase Eha subunit G
MTGIWKLIHLASKGRTLLTVLATEVVLFVIANVTYGSGNDKHGAMRSVSNVVWAIFLVGFVVMIAVALTALVQKLRRRQGHGVA